MFNFNNPLTYTRFNEINKNTSTSFQWWQILNIYHFSNRSLWHIPNWFHVIRRISHFKNLLYLCLCHIHFINIKWLRLYLQSNVLIISKSHILLTHCIGCHTWKYRFYALNHRFIIYLPQWRLIEISFTCLTYWCFSPFSAISFSLGFRSFTQVVYHRVETYIFFISRG